MGQVRRDANVSGCEQKYHTDDFEQRCESARIHLLPPLSRVRVEIMVYLFNILSFSNSLSCCQVVVGPWRSLHD